MLDEPFGQVYKCLIFNNIGKFKETLEIINQLLQSDKLDEITKIACYVVKSYALEKLGWNKIAFEIITSAKLLVNNFNGEESPLLKEWNARLITIEGNISSTWGKFIDALNCYKQSYAIQENLGNKIDQVEILSSIGFCYYREGDFNTSFEYNQNSLLLSKEIGNKYQIGSSLCNLGLTNFGKGDFETSKSNYETSLKISEETGNLIGKANSFFGIGRILEEKNDAKLALDYLNKSLKIFEEIGYAYQIAVNLSYIAQLYFLHLGKLDISMDYFKKSLKIMEDIGDISGIARMQMNISVIHNQRGELNIQMKWLTKSLETIKDSESTFILPSLYLNIGFVYFGRGELDIALPNFLKALELNNDTGGMLRVGLAYRLVGSCYAKMGEFENAFSYFNEGLEISRKMGSSIYISEIIFSIIYELGDYISEFKSISLEEYLPELKHMAEKDINKRIDVQYRLAKALILKRGTRTRQRAEAEILLNEIISENIINYESTIIALKSYCELLLVELKATGENEVIEEISSILIRLLELAKENNLFSLLIEVYLLQSKFYLIKGEIDNASKLVDQALSTAQKYEFRNYEDLVLKEKNTFEKELNDWKIIVNKGASVYERLEASNIDNYLIEMKKRFFM